MCGIAGLLHFDGRPADPLLVQRMGEAVRHRGPDGEGLFVDGPVGLAHRRLAIIDLSPAGHQPMATADGRFVLSYNGEIYNFKELRIELQALGCQFRSCSDSEVVLYALAEWGVEALSRFNGMFAIAMWDRHERALLLARDRYGIKPLYWARKQSFAIFGSEVKALLAHPEFPAAIDTAALFEYMTFQNFLGERILFKGVHLLAAASWVRLGADGTSRTGSFWDYAFEESGLPRSRDEYQEELDFRLRQAVNRQLVSDVPVGSFLSGGMDSGTITALAARQIPNIRTFTVGFDLSSASGLELGFDERVVAERMSYLFRTEHYEMVLKAGDMERVMRKLVWHLEEPRVGQSYPNYYAAQLASKFGKVVLAGTGGDELFGGYPWRYYRAVVNDDFDHYVDKYFQFWQRLIPVNAVADVFQPIQFEVMGIAPREIFKSVFSHHASRLTRPEDYINHSLYFEAKTFLHGLLVVEDKLAMAHGLELRVPFLDNDLVDLAMSIPVRMKLGNLGEVVKLNENEPGAKTHKFFERTRDGKLLLRDVMRRYLPADVTDGEKRGFSAPDASWFRGESIDYVREVLYSPHARIYDYLDRTAVRRLMEDHFQGRENRRLLIWSLLSIEIWLDTFL